VIKVLDTPWHIVHNRRLMSIPWMHVYLFDPAGRQFWKERHRPRPEEMPNFGGWVRRYDPGEYDLIVLHLDNWCAGGPSELRAAPYRYLTSLIPSDDPTPQVVICHGRPNDNLNRVRTVQMLEGRWLVLNSHIARAEWRYPWSEAIWHGYQVDEWPQAHFEETNPYALTVCSGGDLSRFYHGIPIIERLKRDVPRFFWLGTRGDFKCSSFDQYREVLRRARCYVHTTQWAPMSGARTEAMLCGVPVVTTAMDDEACFLVDGENAFVTNDYTEMRERVQQLLKDDQLAQRIGQAGRETVRRLFSVEAYAGRWAAFLQDRVGIGGIDG
jgi:hypothetical protein